MCAIGMASGEFKQRMAQLMRQVNVLATMNDKRTPLAAAVQGASSLAASSLSLNGGLPLAGHKRDASTMEGEERVPLYNTALQRRQEGMAAPKRK